LINHPLDESRPTLDQESPLRTVRLTNRPRSIVRWPLGADQLSVDQTNVRIPIW